MSQRFSTQEGKKILRQGRQQKISISHTLQNWHVEKGTFIFAIQKQNLNPCSKFCVRRNNYVAYVGVLFFVEHHEQEQHEPNPLPFSTHLLFPLDKKSASALCPCLPSPQNVPLCDPPPPCFYFFWVPKKWETGEHSKLFRSGKGGIMQISFPIFSAEACRDKKSWFVSIQINRRRGGFRAAFLGRNGSSFFCSSYSLAILHTCTHISAAGEFPFENWDLGSLFTDTRYFFPSSFFSIDKNWGKRSSVGYFFFETAHAPWIIGKGKWACAV